MGHSQQKVVATQPPWMMGSDRRKKSVFRGTSCFKGRQTQLTNGTQRYYQSRKSAQPSANSCVISQLLDSPSAQTIVLYSSFPVGIIVAQIGLSLAVIGAELYGVVLFMAVATTLVAPPFLKSLYANEAAARKEIGPPDAGGIVASEDLCKIG